MERKREIHFRCLPGDVCDGLMESPTAKMECGAENKSLLQMGSKVWGFPVNPDNYLLLGGGQGLSRFPR